MVALTYRATVDVPATLRCLWLDDLLLHSQRQRIVDRAKAQNGTCGNLVELHSSKVTDLNQGCVVQYVSLKRSPLTYNGSLSLTSLPAARTAPSGMLQFMEEFLMKTLFATVTLATLLSSSADAQYGAGRGYYRAHAQVPPNAAYRFCRSPYTYGSDPRVRNQQDWWHLYEESKSGKHCVSCDSETAAAYPSWMRCHRR